MHPKPFHRRIKHTVSSQQQTQQILHSKYLPNNNTDHSPICYHSTDHASSPSCGCGRSRQSGARCPQAFTYTPPSFYMVLIRTAAVREDRPYALRAATGNTALRLKLPPGPLLQMPGSVPRTEAVRPTHPHTGGHSTGGQPAIANWHRRRITSCRQMQHSILPSEK